MQAFVFQFSVPVMAFSGGSGGQGQQDVDPEMQRFLEVESQKARFQVRPSPTMASIILLGVFHHADGATVQHALSLV